MSGTAYTGGAYAAKHPGWHAEDSAWKAEHILRILQKNQIAPKTLVEIGCGSGEILKQLSKRMDSSVTLLGREVSRQALELCRLRESERVRFELSSGVEAADHFDLTLLIDVMEHVPDYLGLLEKVKPQSHHKILHIPLDISVQTVLRASPFERLRREVGHIHYFTKETALAAIEDSGYEVIDWFYTSPSTELVPASSLMRVAKWPRKFLFTLGQELTVRILGGYSLMVLAK